MRRILINILLVSLSAGAFAQTETLTSKKGVPVLPQSGDIAIGADATPYLNYIGNMFNNSSDNSLDLGSQNLYFRYYITNKSAVRFNLSIGRDKKAESFYVVDDAARAVNPLSNDEVEDKETNFNRDISFLIGLQKSRGYGRLKGIYGLQAGYGFSKEKFEYQYGNDITALNPSPSNNWNTGGKRKLEENKSNQHIINFGGFIGAEYYFLPKICVGGELSLMYSQSWESQNNTKYEVFDGQGAGTIEEATKPGDKSSSLKTMRPATYSGLYFMFHF